MVLLFVKAPTLETPVPLMVNGSVALDVSEKPFISKLAPEETVVAPETFPKGPVAAVDETPSFNVPVLTVVIPVYVFTPDKITELFVVAPVFTICNGFEVPLIIPETVKVPVVASPEVPI